MFSPLHFNSESEGVTSNLQTGTQCIYGVTRLYAANENLANYKVFPF